MKNYKRLSIEDQAVIKDFLRHDPPQISEMTFTNLYMWRGRYRPCWRVGNDCLLVVFQSGSEEGPVGLPPVGLGDKRRALEALCRDLKACSPTAKIGRVPEAFLAEHVPSGKFRVTPDPDNSDYVYLTQDLIRLSGRKYHRKKNQLNQFLKSCSYEYIPLDASLAHKLLAFQDTWCRMRQCEEDPGLSLEDEAIREVLNRFGELGVTGGAVLIEGRVEAFALGELLNPRTAVIHIEKANPEIPGLYAAINQLFCYHAWQDVPYVNREQDLGIKGLRQAKRAYHPHHMVEKFILTL